MISPTIEGTAVVGDVLGNCVTVKATVRTGLRSVILDLAREHGEVSGLPTWTWSYVDRTPREKFDIDIPHSLWGVLRVEEPVPIRSGRAYYLHEWRPREG